MNLRLEIGSTLFLVDIESPIDVSIPLLLNGDQPNTYGVAEASSKACEVGDFVGDVRRGGSCNFEEYKLIAHCNGTHTECVGHISYERISILNSLKDVLIPSTLITVEPVRADKSNDTYFPEKTGNDFFISSDSISHSLQNAKKEFLEGLVIRTLPNDDSKRSRKYIKEPPAFFSLEAMRLIADLGVKHLLVDIPSVDRMYDEGKLSAHHIFWNVQQGTNRVNEKEHSAKTITEMIYVPEGVADGNYLLNLQIAAFSSDASPSRPILFKLLESNTKIY